MTDILPYLWLKRNAMDGNKEAEAKRLRPFSITIV
jgi:hypothetical protein